MHKIFKFFSLCLGVLVALLFFNFLLQGSMLHRIFRGILWESQGLFPK